MMLNEYPRAFRSKLRDGKTDAPARLRRRKLRHLILKQNAIPIDARSQFVVEMWL
jgi:hypothetical protein